MIVERLEAAEFPIRHLLDGFQDNRLEQFPDPDRVQRADQAILSGPIDVGMFDPLFWVLDEVDHLIELFEIAAWTFHSVKRHRRLRSHREFASKNAALGAWFPGRLPYRETARQLGIATLGKPAVQR